MSRKVTDERLEALHVRVVAEVGRRPGVQWVSVEGHELSCLLDELRRRRKVDGRSGTFKLSKTTRTLLLMKEGDICFLPPTTIGAITNARATARKHLANPDAVWACQTQPDGGVRVERMADGSDRHFGKPRNPAIAEMSALKVGQSAVIAGPMYAALKQQVRKSMGDRGLGADWRCETLNTGRLRVTRTK